MSDDAQNHGRFIARLDQVTAAVTDPEVSDAYFHLGEAVLAVDAALAARGLNPAERGASIIGGMTQLLFEDVVEEDI